MHEARGAARLIDSRAIPVLKLRDVAKRYRRRVVLDGLDLALGRGEIVGLLGPNGSGKTTTLRIAAGLLWPDRGAVEVAGEPLTPERPALRTRIGYLPERVPLYDPMTVRGYLDFVAGARGLASTRRRAAVADALTAFDLEAVAGRVIGYLSKGFRQRIGLAQALIAAPDVLLLDEPTNGLDPFQIIEARAMIVRASEGRGVIFSTHILQEVAALCTRVVYLHGGRLVTLNPAASAARRLRAVIVCTDPAPVVDALRDLDAGIGVRVPHALGTRRWQLDIELAAGGGASRAAVARVLATTAELESFAADAFELEAALEQALAGLADAAPA